VPRLGRDEVSNDLNSIAGLPDELGIGDDLARAEQRLSISVDRRRYGKPMTVVEGFEPGAVDLEELASTLKRALAVGGTVTEGRIELQGAHDDRLRAALEAEGFSVDA
jgi:translation initiation factor 1